MRFSTLFASLAIGGLVASQGIVGPRRGDARLVYVGTYTNARSLGIYAFRFDDKTGTLSPMGLAAATRNPSFLAASADGRFLFAVNEVDDYEGGRSGSVTSFAAGPEAGKLAPLTVQATHGADPCHLSLDRTGRFLAVANYSSGSLAVLPVDAEGRLGPAVSVVRHEGHGADPERQEGPHAHQVSFSADNRFLFAVDLGLDRVAVYRFDARTGALAPHEAGSVSTPPGAGPRHLAFHPDGTRAWVVNELSSTVTALQWNAGEGAFRAGETISTLPAAFDGRSAAAEIAVAPGGRFLYVSNRGHDSLAVFSIAKDRTLEAVEWEPSGGRGPRHFAMDPAGRWMIAANQQSGTLAVFRIDPATGKLTPSGSPVESGAPVCVLFGR